MRLERRLPPGLLLLLRLLSLHQRDRLELSSFVCLPAEDAGEAVGDAQGQRRDERAGGAPAGSSQLDGIRALLHQAAAQGSANGSTGEAPDPRRALAARIAAAVLQQGQQQAQQQRQQAAPSDADPPGMAASSAACEHKPPPPPPQLWEAVQRQAAALERVEQRLAGVEAAQARTQALLLEVRDLMSWGAGVTRPG